MLVCFCSGCGKGAPEPDPEVAALREEVARLRSERGRVKGLKSQLERSVAHLQEQRASFLKQQARPLSLPVGAVAHACAPRCAGDNPLPGFRL